MHLLQNIRHGGSRLVYALSESLPESWSKRFSILACVLKQDWRTVRFVSPTSSDIGRIGMEEILCRFAGLDERSISLAKKYVGKTHFYPDLHWVTALPPHPAYLWAGLCTESEYREGVRQEQELISLEKIFHLPAGRGDVSSLIHHHGLKNLSPALKSHLMDKVCIDAGAFIGDSTLVFLEYAPFRVYAFDPSPANGKAFVETMSRNRIPTDKAVLVPKGLSNRKGSITFSENADGTSLRLPGACRANLTTLDDFARDIPRPVGLIKADVEGMGLDLVEGSLETIKKDLPILSLCIYHNKEEFFGIYELLKSLDLNYEFKLESFCAPWKNNELTLLALPKLA